MNQQKCQLHSAGIKRAFFCFCYNLTEDEDLFLAMKEFVTNKHSELVKAEVHGQRMEQL